MKRAFASCLRLAAAMAGSVAVAGAALPRRSAATPCPVSPVTMKLQRLTVGLSPNFELWREVVLGVYNASTPIGKWPFGQHPFDFTRHRNHHTLDSTVIAKVPNPSS